MKNGEKENFILRETVGKKSNQTFMFTASSFAPSKFPIIRPPGGHEAKFEAA